MGDERTRDGAADGRAPRRLRGRRRPAPQPPAPSDPAPAREPITVEQLIARQGGDVGRRRAARTGDIPLPAALGEPVPVRRHERPAVPADDVRTASDEPSPRTPRGRRAGDGERPGPEHRRPDDTPAARRGLPPVPGASTAGPGARPGSPQPPAADQPPRPGLPPVPPSGRPSEHLLPPLEDRPGYRHSRPISPLPPIPGRDAPAAGASRLTPPGPRERRAARRAARTPGRRRLIRAALGLVVLVGVVVAYHLGLYFYVDRSIDRVEALAPEGAEVLAPRLQEEAATYLVVGTGVPGQDGPAGVSTLLVHVAPDEERAVLVSIPPTALVDTPACVRPDGEVREPATEAFASSLLDGGPACTVRAVQQLSGLRIDHYLGVDLGRLPGMVDALGGIEICLPVPTAAVAASANPLPAGSSDLSGEQASGYLTPGDAGSDVTGAAVAERAQLLLMATLRSAMSLGTIGNPVTLTRFLTHAADALSVDEGTNLGDLRTLAGTLGDLSGGAVQRSGLPVAQVGYVPAGTDQAHVLLDAPGTRALFDQVIDESRLPEALVATQPAGDAAAAPPAPPTAEQPATPPAQQPLTAAPAGITVDVLNGTATSGLAATVGDLLRAQGFVVGTVGNEQGTVNESVVRYGPGADEAARTVAAAVPGSVLQPSDSIGAAVQLVLGPGYSTVVPVEVAPAAAAPAPGAETPAEPSTGPAASSEPVTC